MSFLPPNQQRQSTEGKMCIWNDTQKCCLFQKEKHSITLTSQNEAGDDFGVDELPTSVVSTLSATIGNLSATLISSQASRASDESSAAVVSCDRVKCRRFWRVICSRHRFVCAFTRSRAHAFLPLVPRASGLDSWPVREKVRRVASVVFDFGENACNRDNLLVRWPDVQSHAQISPTLLQYTVILSPLVLRNQSQLTAYQTKLAFWPIISAKKHQQLHKYKAN